MVIASIDLQNGKVVQLKQGSELVLQRDNPLELASEFDRYGEVAVIDLDAAMGKSSNLELIKPILRRAECRVGGGIRTPEQAKELVSLGAQKIIIGSSAFRNSEKKSGSGDGEFGVNIPFLEAMAKKIGRQRVIAAVDARGSEIVVDGWKTPTGLDLFEAARLVEPFVSELLFTCVEREGTMTGIDPDPVKKLRETVSCKITVAGGISTLDEITTLSAIGCDIQLGMALYTGKITLADAFIASLNWKKGAPQASGGKVYSTKPQGGEGSPLEAAENIASAGVLQSKTPKLKIIREDDFKHSLLTAHCSLLPLIVQSPDGQVLMTGFTDAEALAETFKRGNVCFHSRTRGKLWMKGETSGNTLSLVRMRADCDGDALLAVAEPQGPVCHTGAWSCFGTSRRFTWEYLQNIIADRFRNPVPGSYTATLDDDLVREKIMEEAQELCDAKSHDEIVWEAADLLYFSTALAARSGVTVQEILDELERRHNK